jgi:small subunit ribosomal protein S6
MAKKAQKHYETTFIVDSILEDEKVDVIVSRYTNFLAKNQAEVLKSEKWGRKKLSYPVKKRTTGNFVSVEFTADPLLISKLERAYHLDDDVLRFLNVEFDKKTLIQRNAYLVKKEQILKEREAAAKELEQQSAQGPEAEAKTKA